MAALYRSSAFLRGRDYVIPEDVKFVWVDAIAHRLLLPAGSAGGARQTMDIAAEVLSTIRAPRLR